MNHWICIQLKGDRTYAGNPGYADDLGKHYDYDSFVGNHRQVSPDDVLVLRDRTEVIGLGQVQDIESFQSTKTHSRCPQCGTTQIKARARALHRFRCSNGHEFDTPREEQVPCTTFRARFRQPFLLPVTPLDAKTVRRAELRPSDQQAIARANLGMIIGPLRQSFPHVDELLDRASMATGLQPEAAADESIEDPALDLSTLDSRERSLREIRLRRGSRSFRQAMMRRFNSCCAVSGCTLVDVLEAAHVKPYRGLADNHLTNGLLLRTDLHTLFDLNLLAIDPNAFIVRLHPKLLTTEYGVFEGKPLTLPKQLPLAKQPLVDRWEAFQRSLGNSAS